MNVDEKTMGIVGGIVLIFGMVVLYLQLTTGTQSPAPPPPPAVQASAGSHSSMVSSVPVAATEGYGAPCGSSAGSCLADYEVKAEGCEQVRSREKIANVLANPIAAGSCATIEAQLQQGCAPGCQLDSSSLVIVPGKIEYMTDPQRDGLGRCTVRGKRAVRVSGECITSAAPQ